MASPGTRTHRANLRRAVSAPKSMQARLALFLRLFGFQHGERVFRLAQIFRRQFAPPACADTGPAPAPVARPGLRRDRSSPRYRGSHPGHRASRGPAPRLRIRAGCWRARIAARVASSIRASNGSSVTTQFCVTFACMRSLRRDHPAALMLEHKFAAQQRDPRQPEALRQLGTRLLAGHQHMFLRRVLYMSGPDRPAEMLIHGPHIYCAH